MLDICEMIENIINREYNMPRNSMEGNAIPKAPRNINIGHSCV